MSDLEITWKGVTLKVLPDGTIKIARKDGTLDGKGKFRRGELQALVREAIKRLPGGNSLDRVVEEIRKRTKKVVRKASVNNAIQSLKNQGLVRASSNGRIYPTRWKGSSKRCKRSSRPRARRRLKVSGLGQWGLDRFLDSKTGTESSNSPVTPALKREKKRQSDEPRLEPEYLGLLNPPVAPKPRGSPEVPESEDEGSPQQEPIPLEKGTLSPTDPPPVTWILVDVPNLFISTIKNREKGSPSWVKKKVTRWVEDEYGIAPHKIIYFIQGNQRDWIRPLNRETEEYRVVDRKKLRQDGAIGFADIDTSMVKEASTILESGNVSRIVIASGDGDFTVIAEACHEHGIPVETVGSDEESLSRYWFDIADRVSVLFPQPRVLFSGENGGGNDRGRQRDGGRFPQ
ncbi:MAG: NYN domain-containing protein [Promethearchaeota archaeon]